MSEFNKDPFFDNEEVPTQTENKPVPDPFFDGEDENTTVSEQSPTAENTQEEAQKEEKSAFERSFPSYTVGEQRADSKPYRPEKARRSPSLLLIIAIMIPILVLTNVFTSVMVFEQVWSDARAELQEEINKVLSSSGAISGEVNAYLAFSVAQNNMDSVVEITATHSGGTGSGSGFITTADGYIITNAHVITYEQTYSSGFGRPTQTTVKVCPNITCNFKDSSTTYNLTVIAYDETLDVAVCKMANPPANLQPVKFADSTLLQYGEPCVAIGNAQGYGLAVTEGVISAPIQYFMLSGNTTKTAAVQHSAAINPGNSGGPLYNMYGMVIGINTFKLTHNSDIAIDGMGFAIPSAVVKDYVNSLNIEGLIIEYSTPEILDGAE